MFVAIRAGLFESLRRPRTLDELASEGGYEPSALRSLVRALRACGHLRVDENGTYRLTESAARYFLHDSRDFVGDALSFLRTTTKYEEYPRILREGGSMGLNADQWAYVTRTSATYAPSGVETLLRCCPELTQRAPLRVLDVGCGQGTYLLELARALPRAVGLGIDPTPGVAEAARANVASVGSRVRIEEATLADVSEKFDVVLINQIFHVVGVEASLEMLVQARSRLVPGGHIFIQEIVAHDADPGSTLFGFNMRMLFVNGTVFELEELMRMVAGANFTDVRALPIAGLTPGLVYVGGRAS